jgi:NADH-ubiquinone/plastoquinone oxidoreductase subunit 3
MSFAPAAILVVLAVAVAVPGVVLGVAVLLAGRPKRLLATNREPDIHAFLMLVVLGIVAVAAMFLLPFAVAFGGLPHKFTAVEGLFLAVLALLGVGYAWRRGVLRWQ